VLWPPSGNQRIQKIWRIAFRNCCAISRSALVGAISGLPQEVTGIICGFKLGIDAFTLPSEDVDAEVNSYEKMETASVDLFICCRM